MAAERYYTLVLHEYANTMRCAIFYMLQIVTSVDVDLLRNAVENAN